jgi:hypothetical protein
MKELISELNKIEGVRTARMQGEKLLKIEPYAREQRNQEAKKIAGDLKKITPEIKNVLDSSSEVNQWEWNAKPKKRYKENEINNSVTDRKPKGHKPAHYLVTVHKESG